MNSFINDMADYICSGHALLHVDTFEKDRAIKDICDVAAGIDRRVYVWSVATGWHNQKGEPISDVKVKAPIEDHLAAIAEFDEGTICILRDFGCYVKHETYPGFDVVVGWLDTLRRIVSSQLKTIICVGPEFDVPKAILHDVTRVDFDLPSAEQIKERVEFACGDVTRSDGSKFELDKSIVPQIVNACRGMTSQQTVDRVTLSLRKHKDLNGEAAGTILREKAAVIRASGLLTYIEPPEGGLDNVGGYDALKRHVILDKPCFTQEAREFGIEFPRGILMVGVAGCGKTMLSLAIASELGLPLISLDIGSLMNKFVGESEHNLREAIKMIESMAPCVLQMDEIEKGFGGAGDMDGGASRRMFGTFIRWANDRTSPVYFVATANQVQSLPPEFCRKGRFDEIYGLALPEENERAEIFGIHIGKRGRDINAFDVHALAKKTKGYTGADIEQIVKLGLKMAFASGDELGTNHLKSAIEEIIPLSKTESQRIEEITAWCAKHAKPANPKIETATTVERKVTL